MPLYIFVHINYSGVYDIVYVVMQKEILFSVLQPTFESKSHD